MEQTPALPKDAAPGDPGATREEELRRARDAIERLPDAEKNVHLESRLRLQQFMWHVVGSRGRVAWVQDGRNLLAEENRAEMNLDDWYGHWYGLNWHDLNPGYLSIEYDKGTRLAAFRAAPTHWLVLCGLIFMLGAFIATDAFDFPLLLLQGANAGGYSYGALVVLIAATLMTVPVVRGVRFMNRTTGSELSIAFLVRYCFAESNADDALAADVLPEGAVENFLSRNFLVRDGFVRIPGTHVRPADIRRISLTKSPQGLLELVGLTIAAAASWCIAVGLVWLGAFVPEHGFWGGLLRSAGMFAIFSCIGVGIGSVVGLVGGIVDGTWARTRHAIKLRLSGGDAIKVGDCHRMHQQQIRDALASRIGAIDEEREQA